MTDNTQEEQEKEEQARYEATLRGAIFDILRRGPSTLDGILSMIDAKEFKRRTGKSLLSVDLYLTLKDLIKEGGGLEESSDGTYSINLDSLGEYSGIIEPREREEIKELPYGGIIMKKDWEKNIPQRR